MFGQPYHSSSTKRRGFDVSASSLAVRSRRFAAILDAEYGDILQRIENKQKGQRPTCLFTIQL